MNDLEEFLIWESEHGPETVEEDDEAYWNAVGNALGSPTLSGKPPWEVKDETEAEEEQPTRPSEAR